MAEEDEEGRGGIGGMLSRKVGPFAIWTWLMLAGAAGLIIYRMRKGQTASAGSGASGQGTQFNSSQTQSGTTPSGGQYTSTYSASGNGYLPGQLTYGASPMPVSGGDVYVNYPAGSSNTTTTGAPAPATPSKPYTVTATQDPQGNWDSNAIGLATVAYGLKTPTAQDATLGASQIVAANPQIDWAQPLAAGTVVNIPLRFIASMFESKVTPYNQSDTAGVGQKPG